MIQQNWVTNFNWHGKGQVMALKNHQEIGTNTIVSHRKLIGMFKVGLNQQKRKEDS